MLLNYLGSELPQTLHIIIRELSGFYDQAGLQTHAVATLVPSSVPSAVYNQGGIVGYNIVYSLVGPTTSWDITGQTMLTFDLK